MCQPLKQLPRTATVAWCAAEAAPTLVALGSSANNAGDLGADATLSFAKLDFSAPGSDVETIASVKTPESLRFSSISWSKFGVDNNAYPLGIVAGGLQDGVIALWNPSAIVNSRGQDAGLIHTGKVHNGTVHCVECHPAMPNLIATCGADGEVNILDITNPQTPRVFKPSNNPSKHIGSEVLCCAWNRKVPHILCSSSNNGLTVVWDLKQQKEVISFKDPANRLRCSSVVWNPDVPTQLLVAYDDDRNPSLQMWDLRNCQYPFKETAAHGKGILAVSWNDMDANLLLSCGKDNRMIVWCLSSGTPELFCEIACPQQTFEGKWAPFKPGLISAASFTGAVTFHSMTQSQTETVKYCPKWNSKPSGVSFGFGGKMLSFGKKKEGAGSWCHSLLVPNEPEIVPAADNFESWIAEKKLKDYCMDKVRKSGGQHEELMWQVMSTHFATEGKSSLPKLLGFDSDQILQKAESFLGSKPGTTLQGPPPEAQQQAVSGSPVASQSAPAPMMDLGDAEDFFTQLTEGREKKEAEERRKKEEIEQQLANAMTALPPKDESQTDWSGGAELMIKESLLIGNLPAAVECCFKCGKMAEGLLLASGGGNELFAAARDEFLRLKGDAFLTSMGNIMTNDFEKLVANSNLSTWTETLAILATYSDSRFPQLCEQLASRLEKEKFDTRSAVVCYICAGNFSQTVNIWTTQPSQGTQKLALQDLVEKMAVLQDAVKFSQADNVFNSKLTQYADILANSGRTVAAMRYLMLLRDDTSSAILRDRIFNSDPRQMSQLFGGRPQFPFQSVDVRVTYRPPAPAPTAGFAPHGAPKAPGHPGMPAPGHPGVAPHPGHPGVAAPHAGHPGVGGHPGMPGVRAPHMPAPAPAPSPYGGPGMHAPAPAPAPSHSSMPPAPRMPTAPTMPSAGPGVQPPGYPGMSNAPAPMPPTAPSMPPHAGMGHQPHASHMPPNAGVGVQPPSAGVGVMPPGQAPIAHHQQQPIGGPPPGPPKASTAPTASAMPVVDGMPTPWPLPTKTQQIRSTNEAVKGANQAVQDASAGAGIVQMVGDPMNPNDVQRIKGLFEMLLNNSPAAANPRQRDDLTKRLEDLYSKLSQGLVKNAVSEKVMSLVTSLEGQDVPSAARCAAELATMDWDVNKNWVMAVKRLVPQR